MDQSSPSAADYEPSEPESRDRLSPAFECAMRAPRDICSPRGSDSADTPSAVVLNEAADPFGRRLRIVAERPAYGLVDEEFPGSEIGLKDVGEQLRVVSPLRSS